MKHVGIILTPSETPVNHTLTKDEKKKLVSIYSLAKLEICTASHSSLQSSVMCLLIAYISICIFQ